MSRTLIISLFAVSAAWALYYKSRSASARVIPAIEAAEKLRQAWADNHTTA